MTCCARVGDTRVKDAIAAAPRSAKFVMTSLHDGSGRTTPSWPGYSVRLQRRGVSRCRAVKTSSRESIDLTPGSREGALDRDLRMLVRGGVRRGVVDDDV